MIVSRRGVVWVLAALLGLAVTAALTWSVSQLAGQRIGLASEPLSVSRGLAPARSTRLDPIRERDEARSARPKPTPTPGALSPASAVPAPEAPSVPARTTQPAQRTQTGTQVTHTSTAAPTNTPVGSHSSGGADQRDDSGGGGGQSGGHSGRDD